MATKMDPTDIIFVKLRAIAFKSRSKSDRDGENRDTQAYFRPTLKLLSVQGAILVLKGEARTTAAVLAQACRRLDAGMTQGDAARW